MSIRHFYFAIFFSFVINNVNILLDRIEVTIVKSKRKNKKELWLVLIFMILGLVFKFDDGLYEKLTDTVFRENTNIEENIDGNIDTEGELLKVSFLDVGQADSILINANNKYMLIDAGNNEDGEKLVTYLKSLGIEKFDYVVGTHAHEDHIGGMDNIIDSFDIGTFYMPDVITTTKTFEDVLDSLEKKNLNFDTPQIGSTFDLGKAKIETIYVGNDSKNLNDSSIILKLTYGNISFLFTGDTESDVEKTLLNKDIESDVLKVAHHGSNTSSSNAFLKKVNPKYAIISVGAGNSYGHPKSVILDRLEKLETKIYRTDELGTIIVTTDGEKIEVSNIKTDTNGN